jgi:hypothetical protein
MSYCLQAFGYIRSIRTDRQTEEQPAHPPPGQGSLLKDGKCNEANNAPALAEYLIGIGSGNVSFR